ncbi:UDP-N-acetylmuramate--alanine ligase [Thermotomaculum hydrothermale]|uniref:UDP-N-acetylmuramate--L-alanine ligase n=1 Tax=Thermotomaculum hydrothermale TaxID=981385 RepID=A0A7R6PHN6_9BACT|nr:UDP-N-acetylmuramate--L-alanine ligase [Thermotomaculum hydrothermale]BBB32799.1 UDP-N-acetylmuramate--alanine ligase [Thermotomaculum hydrothermale]
MFWRIKTIHFIGIGGTGMSGIAEVLHNLKFNVQGSDLNKSIYTERLENLGIKVFYGHNPHNLDGADLVVISTAIKGDNIEVIEAKKRGIPIIRRGEMLAELMRMKYGIAISGTHGKTTTTAMAASVFNEAGLDPTVIIGGIFQKLNSNAKLGNSRFLIAEADESDKSHLNLSPVFVVITNIDLDHLDFYKDLDDIKETFKAFANKVPFFGSIILNADDKNCLDIIPGLNKRVVTYGFSEKADYSISDLEKGRGYYSFKVKEFGKSIGEFKIKVPGVFNVQNATAVIALAKELRISSKKIKAGLEAYTGTKRRCEVVGERGKLKVITDYAHHPVEIKSTINALSDFYKTDKILVVFQPHRYTRTKALFDDFIECFPEKLNLILLPIYPAGEKPIKGVSSELLCKKISKKEVNCSFVEDKEALLNVLDKDKDKYDLIVFLGAGYIDNYAREFGRTINE